MLLVWLYINRFSFSGEEQHLVLILVSQLKRKRVTKMLLILHVVHNN